MNQLEVLACDSNSLAYRPSEIALALLTTHFQQRIIEQPSHANVLMGFVSVLQKYCKVTYFDDFLTIEFWNFYLTLFDIVYLYYWFSSICRSQTTLRYAQIA